MTTTVYSDEFPLPVLGRECTHRRNYTSDRVEVLDEEGEVLFSISGSPSPEQLAEVVHIQRRSFTLGTRAGRTQLQQEFNRLLGNSFGPAPTNGEPNV